MAFSLTAFISGISRMRGHKQWSKNRNVPSVHPSFKRFYLVYQCFNRDVGLKESFKQRAWSAPFMAFSLIAFISGIIGMRGLKQSSNN